MVALPTLQSEALRFSRSNTFALYVHVNGREHDIALIFVSHEPLINQRARAHLQCVPIIPIISFSELFGLERIDFT
jgi:hypothetical protein